MNDAVNGRVLVKDVVEGLFIGNVDVVEGRTAAAKLLDAVEDDFERVVEVVDNDDVVIVFEESQSGKGANVAGSSGLDWTVSHCLLVRGSIATRLDEQQDQLTR